MRSKIMKLAGGIEFELATTDCIELDADLLVNLRRAAYSCESE